MPLTSKDINFILNLLNEDTCGTLHTFEKICEQFQREISSNDFLLIGNALVLFLQNRDLITTHQQRLIIFFIFFIMYPCEKQTIDMNPFAPVFLDILQTNRDVSQRNSLWIVPSVTTHERTFVQILLNQRTNEILPLTPNRYLQLNVNINENHSEDILKEKLRQRKEQWPRTAQCHLSAVINDPEINPYGFDSLPSASFQRVKDQHETIEELLKENLTSRTIRPDYLRLVPPLHECSLDELIWLDPIDEDRSTFHWDISMCSISDFQSEMRLLMNRAYQGSLNLQQQQKLIDEFKTHPELLDHVGFSSRKFPILVENYPILSVECLSKYSSSNSIDDYLQALVNMEASVHSMEVVNRLSTLIPLPQEFLHLYISSCIQKCEETKDKSHQHRIVRLASVFIQSLIRNKVIDVKDFYAQVQEFSLHFRKIKEAASLFQLLKTFHSTNDDQTSTSISDD